MVQIVALLLLGAGAASATTAPAYNANDDKQSVKWSGSVSLGFLAANGNAKSTSLSSAFAVAYTTGRVTHSLKAAANRATQAYEVTTEAYLFDMKSEYDFTERDFLFVRMNWRKDRVGGYARQVSEAIGYGRRVTETGSHRFDATIGAGRRQASLSDDTAENGSIVLGGFNYRWQLSDSVQFVQSLILESAPTNTFGESVSAIKTSLIGNLALVASYTIKSNSEVPVGKENSDSLTAVSLEYDF